MFNPGKALGRALLSGIFITGGKGTFENAAHVAPMADAFKAKYGLNDLPLDSKQLVQANAATMVALGSTLALGIKPTLSAMGLLGTLAPTTLAAHDFWNKSGAEKNQDMIQFFKNVAIGGGLLYVVASSK